MQPLMCAAPMTEENTQNQLWQLLILTLDIAETMQPVLGEIVHHELINTVSVLLQ